MYIRLASETQSTTITKLKSGRSLEGAYEGLLWLRLLPITLLIGFFARTPRRIQRWRQSLRLCSFDPRKERLQERVMMPIRLTRLATTSSCLINLVSGSRFQVSGRTFSSWSRVPGLKLRNQKIRSLKYQRGIGESPMPLFQLARSLYDG